MIRQWRNESKCQPSRRGKEMPPLLTELLYKIHFWSDLIFARHYFLPPLPTFASNLFFLVHGPPWLIWFLWPSPCTARGLEGRPLRVRLLRSMLLLMPESSWRTDELMRKWDGKQYKENLGYVIAVWQRNSNNPWNSKLIHTPNKRSSMLFITIRSSNQTPAEQLCHEERVSTWLLVRWKISERCIAWIIIFRRCQGKSYQYNDINTLWKVYQNWSYGIEEGNNLGRKCEGNSSL